MPQLFASDRSADRDCRRRPPREEVGPAAASVTTATRSASHASLAPARFPCKSLRPNLRTLQAQWCALAPGGELAGEGRIAADRDGLARLVLELGDEVKACLEMMSGALWVRDQLVDCGWQVEVADARKVKTVAPLAAKTDKVDARLLAELCPRSTSGRYGNGCGGGCTWSGCGRARKVASSGYRRSGASASRSRACAGRTA